MRAWIKMPAIVVAVTFLTRFIPFADFFRNVNTLIHRFYDIGGGYFRAAIVWALLFATFSLWCAKKATSLMIKSSWIAKI